MELYIGDCKEQLLNIPDKLVDLIYLDPPFYTQKEQVLSTRDNKKEYKFEDSWETIQNYAQYIEERLVACHRVLKNTGSIFLHCDRNASHYLRLALDNVFGYDNFQSEIIWSYKRWSNSKKGLLNGHQTIYFYSKSKDFKFNNIYTDYSPTTNIDQIFQERIRNGNGKSAYKLDASGKAVLGKGKKGVPLTDVWEIPFLNPKAQERVGYPTQKPILLLEQIIKLVTGEGDTVLDPFCGSGTTLVAAKLLNRKYIGIDISGDAIELARSRLANPIKTESALLQKGKDAYLNQDSKIETLLKSISASIVHRNKGIDGFLQLNGNTTPVPIRVQRENESITEAFSLLVKACEKNNYQQKILIQTDAVKSSMFDLDEKALKDNNTMVVDISNNTAI